MEDMTWQETSQQMQMGKLAAIVPIGGTAQSGPHMVLGKHNIIVRHAAGKIAEKLGWVLVTPVMPFAPEGALDPKEGNMLFSGTISIPERDLGGVLEGVAGSLKAHGFRLICFIGDGPGSQAIQQKVADKLTNEWKHLGVKVLHVSSYFGTENGQTEWLKSQGEEEEDIGTHGGMADTSELMAIDPKYVRDHLRKSYYRGDFSTKGANGNALRASEKFGEKLLQLKIDAAAKQIQEAAVAKKAP